MFMIKKLFLLLLIPFAITAQDLGFKLIDVNNNKLLYTSTDGKGLYLASTNGNLNMLLESDFSAGYMAKISADGKYVAYKNIYFTGDNSVQIPMLYNLIENKNIPLSEPQIQCGVPSVSASGKIAFTKGNELVILNPDLTINKKINIGNYVNIASISPDGNFAALNDKNNQIYILDNNSLSKTYITTDGNYYYEPEWSPDGQYISYKNAQSDIFVYNVQSRASKFIAKGSLKKWDGNSLYFTETNHDSDARLLSTRAVKYNAKHSTYAAIVSGSDYRISSSLPYMGSVIYTLEDKDMLFSNALSKSEAWLNNYVLGKNAVDAVYEPLNLNKTANPAADKVIVRFDSVYFNQVYDCRIDRAGIGDGCCGAASALMGLMYYKLLPEWGYQSLNKSYSPFANYLSEVYTYKGVTYNISYTRSGGGYYNTGLGMYGWIYRNSLEDTKGHMASLLTNHGLQSGVDWSPTVQKAINEVDGGFPLVLLNSLTTSGHYIVLTGYAERVGTLIFNDPYGDRNRSSYLRDNAKRIKYDYPGYSNGYANLNTSWCYIYMRNAADLRMTESRFEYDYQPNSKIYFSYKLKNFGTVDASVPFKVKLLLSEDNAPDSKDIVLYEKEFSELNLTDSVSHADSVETPKSTATKTFNLFLVADIDGVINEVAKSNNNASFSFTVLGKPATTIIYPFANSTITHSRPTIFISYTVDQKIDTTSARIKLNNVDVTHLFQKYANKMQYYPTNDYTNGNYDVEIYLKNIAGFDTTITWSFKVDAPLVSVKDPEEITTFELLQNYPNPFNPSTKISFSLPEAGDVKIVIFDASGKEIKTVLNEFRNRGRYTIDFNAEGLSSGTYLYRITSGSFSQTKKMLLIK